MNQTMADNGPSTQARPHQTWVTVTDSRGRQRVEARWLDLSALHTASAAHAA